MGPNYIALAVPFFFLLIGIEVAVARKRRRASYRFTDAVADLGCGISQRITLLFTEALLVAAYVLVYQHLRVADLGGHLVLASLFAFVAVDFIYYWWHRASHRMNFLWAAHVIHHQSEDFNLAVALRQSVLTPVTFTPFALPLALIGVPPLIYLAAVSLNTLYQFWIHTELIGKLGPLEAVLNTPSHHRVHHARNEAYLDRNYAAVFIIWDRMFGTFAPERQAPDYGITKPLRSFNPLWAQLQPLAELTALSTTAPSWRDRLRVWLAPPERSFSWSPAHTVAAGAAKYDVPVSARLRAYVSINFALAVLATFLLMLWSQTLPALPLTIAAVLVLAAIVTAGGLMENKRWARPLEAGRLVASAAALFIFLVR
jgi:sterol desaturase/sphingolipid hydroxylase (fatty acid hydroxylase superfamily)